MQEILVVVDMQNDFVTGPPRHSRGPDHPLEGGRKGEKLPRPGALHPGHPRRKLPRIPGGEGAAGAPLHPREQGVEICPELETLRKEEPVDKPTFGSTGLGEVLRAADQYGKRSGRSPLSASAPISASSRMPCSCGPSCRKRRSRSTLPAAPG